MQNSYLKVFDNFFFNVEEHSDMKNTIEQASFVLDSLITKFGEVENEISMDPSNENYFVDLVIISFIRKIMTQLDAINVLCSVCLFEPCQVVLRSLIEVTVSLEFILKENTEERAISYFLEYHYQDLEKAEMYMKAEFEVLKKYITEKEREEFLRDKEKKKRGLERLINTRVDFRQTDVKRNNKLLKKTNSRSSKKTHIQWYEVCSSITSFHGLMREVGYEEYYNAIYGGLSVESHGLNTAIGINVNSDGYSLKWIRNPEGGGIILDSVCFFSINALEKIYHYLGDGEEEISEYKKFYVDFAEKWKLAVHNLDMI